MPTLRADKNFNINILVGKIIFRVVQAKKVYLHFLTKCESDFSYIIPATSLNNFRGFWVV